MTKYGKSHFGRIPNPTRRIPKGPNGWIWSDPISIPQGKSLSPQTMMEREKYFHTLAQIKEQAKNACPGILQDYSKMENYIGHTVVNLSDTTLTSDQISALQKGLTFCPTPGVSNKSAIFGLILKTSIADCA